MRSPSSPKSAHPTDMASPGRPAADEIAALLEPIARQRIPGATDARITNWRAANRGLSTETFLFDLQQDGVDGPTTLKQLVFRRPPGVSLFPDYDLTRQVMVMNRLRDTPIVVPTVCWLDRDDNDLGTPYYVMEQLPTIGTAADFPSYHLQGLYFDATPEQRATMWWGCVQAIADVHALDWRSLRLDKLLMPQRGAHPLEQVVEYCDELLAWGSPNSRRQEFVDAVEWLRDNIYEPEHIVLCWGDSRLSNILYGPQFEVTAVVDWEIAYIGDHEADLAWLLFIDWACRSSRVCRGWTALRAARRPSVGTSRCHAAQCAICVSTRCWSRSSSPCPVIEAGDQAPQRGTAHRRCGPGRLLRRTRPAAAGLAAGKVRRGAVDREVGLDDRPHGAAGTVRSRSLPRRRPPLPSMSRRRWQRPRSPRGWWLRCRGRRTSSGPSVLARRCS